MISSPLVGADRGPGREESAGPSAAELEAHYLLPVYKHLPVEPVRGEGVWLETQARRRILDPDGGHAAALAAYVMVKF